MNHFPFPLQKRRFKKTHMGLMLLEPIFIQVVPKSVILLPRHVLELRWSPVIAITFLHFQTGYYFSEL